MAEKTLGQLADEGAPVCLAFDLVATLCERRGWMPVGFRRIELPDGIVVTVNGTKDEQPDALGVPIPPFHASVIMNGWPGGLFTVFGGRLLAGVEDCVVAALKKEIERIGPVASE